MSQERRSLIGQTLVFYSSIYVFAFFKFLAGFLVARILGPAAYGLRSKFGLVTEYEFFMHLGTYDALAREVPYLRGRGDDAEAERVQDTIFTINLGYSAAVIVLCAIAAVVLQARDALPVYVDFCWFLAAWVLLGKVAEYFRSMLVVDKKTQVLSTVNAAHGFVNALACVVGTYLLGLRGLFIGMIVAEVVRTVWFGAYNSRRPRLRLDPALLWRLYRIGFPIMLAAFLFVMLRSVDRVIIASLMSEQKLGFFTIGTIIAGLIYLSIGDLTRTIFYPRMMERVGAGITSQQSRQFLEDPSLLVAYLVPYVIGVVFALVPLPIEWLLDGFDLAIDVSRLLVMGAFYFSVVSVPILVCVALNHQFQLVVLSACAVLFNVVASLFFLAIQWKIAGVAIGTGIAYLVFCMLMFEHVYHVLGTPLRQRLRFYGLIHWPFLYSTVALSALAYLKPFDETTFLGDVLNGLSQATAFVLIYSIILIPAARLRAFRDLIAAVRSGRRPFGRSESRDDE